MAIAVAVNGIKKEDMVAKDTVAKETADVDTMTADIMAKAMVVEVVVVKMADITQIMIQNKNAKTKTTWSKHHTNGKTTQTTGLPLAGRETNTWLMVKEII